MKTSQSTKHPRRTRRIAAVTAAMVLASAAVASAHDMFVKPARFFVEENSQVLVRILNGTFSKSENSIDRVRLGDVSIASPAGRERLDTAMWTVAGDTSTFRLRTGAAGTYVIGVSTRPSVIALTAKEFNNYLRDDGIPDVLEARRKAKRLQTPARERYSKHVKALVQVGGTRTGEFTTALGYAAEIVPLDNPYALSVGDTLRVRTLVDGQPVANQLVVHGGRAPNGARLNQRNLRSDGSGVAHIALRQRGTWYVKFIHMAEVESDTVDYESKWATLTFQLR